MTTKSISQKNMNSKPAILIDLNVLLDVLQKREPHFEASACILAMVEAGKVDGYLAAHSVTTLFYLYQKKHNITAARANITALLAFLKIAAVDQTTIQQALNLGFEDFEDAVQLVAGMQQGVDCLVTRNLKDFPAALLPVMSPQEFLSVYSL